MLRVYADTDTDILNTNPLAAALLAKQNRFPQLPHTYDDFMVTQGIESQPPGKSFVLLLTSEQQKVIAKNPVRDLVHCFDLGYHPVSNQLQNQKLHATYMYACTHESRLQTDPCYSWNNLPIQQGVENFLEKWSAEPNLMLSIDIALYSPLRVAGVIKLTRSMVELVNAQYSVLRHAGFYQYDDFKQAFVPMHRIRKVDLEFRLKFDVALTSEELIKLKDDKEKLLQSWSDFDALYERRPGYSKDLFNHCVQMTDSLVPTSQWPNFIQTNMLDFDLVQLRCGNALSELMYWQSEFERKLYGVEIDMMYHNYSNERRLQLVKEKLEWRFATVIRAIGALYRPMMMLCNCLPEEAVQSPEAFFDCLNQIAATHIEIDHLELCYKKVLRGMSLSASVLRSGVYFLNHVGRSYFKYVVEYVLEQYRKIFRIGGGLELVPQAQKQIGYSNENYNLVHDDHDDQLGEAVRKARSEIGQSPDDVVKFVEQIDVKRLQQHFHQGAKSIRYTTAKEEVFDLSVCFSMDRQSKALLRLWEDPETSVLSLQLFTMPAALYRRGMVNPNVNDVSVYIVYQTGTGQVWRYHLRRQLYSTTLTTILKEDQLRELISGRKRRQYMFAEYVSLLRNINDDLLRQQSKEAFTIMRSMLEFIDSAQTTQVFCTSILQIQLLLVQMNNLSIEMAKKFEAVFDEDQEAIDEMNEQNKNLLCGMYHLPLVCQYFQQCEAVRFGLLLAKKQIIDANPARRPPSLRSLLEAQFGKVQNDITLDKRFKHLTRVLKPKKVEIELDPEAVSQPHTSGQVLHPGQQTITRISSTGVSQTLRQSEIQSRDDSVEMFENTEDLTFDITSFGSQPDIEEEKEVPAAQSEVFYVEQFSLLQNPEHALEMTQNFESLNIGLGKRPAEAEAEANPIVEESSAKRQCVGPVQSSVHESQEQEALKLLIQATTCKASVRDQLHQTSTFKVLGSNHTFKKVYNVHWRLTLFLRNVQAANLVADGNPDQVDKLVVHTISELMEYQRLKGPRELKAFMAKKDLEHQ